jgi:hypothetical protein
MVHRNKSKCGPYVVHHPQHLDDERGRWVQRSMRKILKGLDWQLRCIMQDILVREANCRL